MNCHALRRRLLAAERPDRADAETSRHLDDCAACRSLRDRLVELERRLPDLPVPSADAAREACKRRLLDPLPVGEPYLVPLRLPAELPRERGQRKLAVAIALVAALLLLVIGVALWPRGGKARPTVVEESDLSVRRAKRDQRVAEVYTERERVDVLAAIAEELRTEARAIPVGDPARKMPTLTRFYGEVVRDDLPAMVKRLPAQQRAAVIEALAEQLRSAESELQRQAAARNLGPNDPLLELAAASREGHDRLRALLHEV
jgi:hypothetical protein